jgi:hypothetical protein
MAVAAATAVVVKQGRQQFGSLFNEIFAVSCTLNPDQLADGAGTSDTVAVPGVALGDMVIAISCSVDLQDHTVTAYVQAAGAVEIRIQNEGAATPDLGSATWKLLIGRPGF